MKALERARICLRAVTPGAFVVLSRKHEAAVPGNARNGFGKLDVGAHIRKIARTEKISGIGHVHVTIGKRREHGRAAEVDTLGTDDAYWLDTGILNIS